MSTDTKRDKCSGGSRNCAAVSGVGSDPDLSPAPKENGPRVTAVESSPGGTGPPPACAADAAVPAGPRSRDSRRLYGVFLLSTLKHIHSFDLLSLGLKTFLSRKTSCWRLDTIENAGQQIY